MIKERSVIIGMMSEICMKARILLHKLENSEDESLLAYIPRKMDELELEMAECVRLMDGA